LLAHHLRVFGAEVFTAATAAVARAVLAGTRVDLLLLDVGLPDVGGLRWCRQLRADPATAGLPILIVSAYADTATIAAAAAAGADGYLTKPYRRADLLTHLQALPIAASAPPAGFYATLATRAAASALHPSTTAWTAQPAAVPA
jgi:DNA-binding response OmpR family regulator